MSDDTDNTHDIIKEGVKMTESPNVVGMPPPSPPPPPSPEKDDPLSIRRVFKEILKEIKERVEKLDGGDLTEAQDIIDLCRLIQDSSVGLSIVHDMVYHQMCDIQDGH